jgi:cytochrome c
MTTGTVSQAESLKGWSVKVRDNEGSYPGNKLGAMVGDGHGLMLQTPQTTPTNYKTDCLSCHIPAQASDWIYVGGYPPLKL